MRLRRTFAYFLSSERRCFEADGHWQAVRISTCWMNQTSMKTYRQREDRGHDPEVGSSERREHEGRPRNSGKWVEKKYRVLSSDDGWQTVTRCKSTRSRWTAAAESAHVTPWRETRCSQLRSCSRRCSSNAITCVVSRNTVIVTNIFYEPAASQKIIGE